MRAIGSRTVRPSRAVTRSRSSPAARRLNVSIRMCSTGTPASTRADRRLDQRRGLAGARTGEHEQRAAAVLDDPPLGGVEHRHGRTGRAAAHQPVSGHAAIPTRRPDSFARGFAVAGVDALPGSTS